MYIAKVLSFLGAWQKIQNVHQGSLEDLKEVLATLNSEELQRQRQESPVNSILRQSSLAALDHILQGSPG